MGCFKLMARAMQVAENSNSVNGGPEIRMIRLELQHACAAIERASLIARDHCDAETKGDLARLLEAAKATLDLIEAPVPGVPKEDVF
jgi:hypothetical protein